MLYFGSGETMLLSVPGREVKSTGNTHMSYLQANLQGLHVADLQANLQGMMDLQGNLEHNQPQIHSIEAHRHRQYTVNKCGTKTDRFPDTVEPRTEIIQVFYSTEYTNTEY